MISQFFILSLRGDVIINRDFRSDLVKTTQEIFYRNVKLYKGDAPPLFNIEGVTFAYLKRQALYLVATTRFDICPSIILEILGKICKIIKDFCGVLSEEAIRKNFVLIYEILDEIIDFGHPQSLSSELIKPHIINEPITIVPDNSSINLNIPKSTFGKLFTPSTISSKAVQRSIKDEKSKKHEIFVDIFEKISVLFNSSGYIINSSIEGCIQMKSYLQGNPPLKLALNEDLQVGKTNFTTGVVLDDCNFHDCVATNEFELNKTLRIHPPDGEFVVMNYRITSDFQTPFRVFPFIEEISSYKLELNLKIKACFPKEVIASYVIIQFPLPLLTANAFNELDKSATNQKVDIKKKEDSDTQMIEWNIKKLQGGSEITLKTRVSLQTNANTYSCRKEISPINMQFEIPMYNVSNLQIKYLRIEEKEKSSNPFRWVRYVTQSSSYICRT